MHRKQRGKSMLRKILYLVLCGTRGTNDQTPLYNNSSQTIIKTSGHQFVVIR